MTDKDALNEFLSESEEILSRLSANFALIEGGTASPAVLDELYRDTHTLKGTSQLFGFRELGIVTHAMESSLSPVRKLQLAPQPSLLDALYKSVDAIEKFIQAFRANSQADESSLKGLLQALPGLVDAASFQFGAGVKLIPEAYFDEPVLERRPTVVVQEVRKADVPEAPAEPAPAPAAAPSDSSQSGPETGGDSTIRVQVGVLDRLMNLVGEMVLVRNQVLQYSSRGEDLEFLNLSQRLDVVTSDLQEQVMRTRMQPIGNVVAKFQRLIRDLSKDLGKKIDLTIQGKDTELDKTLLEAIKDPLTHIVRNSCDHGIEPPAERRSSGKPETGHLLISAYHEGGQVIIEISDDGKGLARKRILDKALERGLIPADKAASLSDREIISLIFLPGFSTAEQVSSVSGRGVGMDVVRTNIEKIGGSVDLESAEGKGTTIRLRIPLTLAIVPAMLVRCEGADFAIPQIKLVELVRVDNASDRDSSFASGIKTLQGKPVYELRGKILPLVDLRQVLKGKAPLINEGDPFSGESTINIVVLNAEGETFGLIVQEVLDTADIVVKPLSKFLKSIGLYSAATILGNGSVALILDPAGIAKTVHLAVKSRKEEGVFAESSGRARNESADAQEYLLFRTASPGKYAIPLCMVNRLEELQKEQVEYSGKQPIVRYRSSILPLINVDSVLEFSADKEWAPASQLPTIVVQRSGRLVGLVVNQILDVTTIEMPIDDSVKDRFGILGNLILGQEVVTVLDTLSIVEREVSKLSDQGTEERKEPPVRPASEGRAKPKVLYAEDVAFFRRQVAKLLTEHGFEVFTENDGKAAVERLRQPGGPAFDLILSDIEMPKMNGYELAKAVRGIPSLNEVPLIALTTRFSREDIEKGKQAGFDRYLEKLNPEVLLSTLADLLKEEAVA